MWIWIVVLLVGALLAYVRLAPTGIAQVHQAIDGVQDRDGKGNCLRVVAHSDGGLARIDRVMDALPRTDVLAGSVQDGRITYITRSQWIGFPDYTTVEADGDHIKLFARLRFGRSDLGVNRDRLERVIAAAQVG